MAVLTPLPPVDGSCSRPSPRLRSSCAPGQIAFVYVAAGLRERGRLHARSPLTASLPVSVVSAPAEASRGAGCVLLRFAHANLLLLQGTI